MLDRLDPFGRSSLPAGFTQEHRVLLLVEAFDAWFEGRQPSDAARLFVAGGGRAWLQSGGDLIGEFWKVRPRRGSHRTPANLSRTLRHRDERQDEPEPED